MSKSIVISSGHGLKIRGASGVLDEVDEARKVVDRAAKLLTTLKVDVTVIHDDVSTNQADNLEYLVDSHNEQGEHDLDVSVHFNAYDDTSKPMGCEVLYRTQEELAGEISEAIAGAGGFIDRNTLGSKYRGDLAFLNGCVAPAVLLEICFVDSTADADLYRTNFESICQAIAEVLSGVEIDGHVEPPEPEEPEEPEDLIGANRVEIQGAVHGDDITIVVNGQRVRGGASAASMIDLDIKLTGDVVLTINGQDFHSGSTIPDNQRNIKASVFGGEGDYNVSAYDEKKVLDDVSYYVALPDRFEGERPKVKVYNRAAGLYEIATIEDVGPWLTDDDYYNNGTRPLAETCANNEEPLPRGPNEGKIPNGAGIDLSPALADALEIDGFGTVDWEFI